MISITDPAVARLGDNEVACAIRYNNSQDVASTSADRFSPLLTGANTTNRTYHFQGWQIRIGFLKGIAHRMTYKHEKPGERITKEELMAILNANGGAGNWRPEDVTANQKEAVAKAIVPSLFPKVWIRNDGAKASLGFTASSLHLDSAAYLQWAARRKNPPKKPIPNF